MITSFTNIFKNQQYDFFGVNVQPIWYCILPITCFALVWILSKADVATCAWLTDVIMIIKSWHSKCCHQIFNDRALWGHALPWWKSQVLYFHVPQTFHLTESCEHDQQNVWFTDWPSLKMNYILSLKNANTSMIFYHTCSDSFGQREMEQLFFSFLHHTHKYKIHH